MGFAWMPDNSADAHGDLYHDDQRAGWRYYRSVSARAVLRSPSGRHALSHSQRPLLASFAAASRVPLGRSRSALAGSRRALSHIDQAASPEDRDCSGAGRGAHAARLTDVPRRPSGWAGPERWRRWA
jgi:hypothetical protein